MQYITIDASNSKYDDNTTEVRVQAWAPALFDSDNADDYPPVYTIELKTVSGTAYPATTVIRIDDKQFQSIVQQAAEAKVKAEVERALQKAERDAARKAEAEEVDA